MENILEKIIKEKKSEELARLDAIKIVNSLFSELLEREKDILSRRFGLKGDKGETLEKIGSLHKLTRERVRQIEAASVKKIKKLDNLSESVGDLKKTVSGLIAEHGGLIRRDYLLDILTVMTMELDDNNGISEAEYEQNRASYRNHFNFLISLKKTYSTEELIELLKQLDSYNKYQEKLKASETDLYPVFKSQVFPDKAEIINSNKVLYSLMQAVKNLEQNKYGEWGIADWQEIKPKTVNDKIYLILKHEAKPLHFTEIAKKINDMKFDRKIANAATVHNELILDSRYVLVGRGTYGLKEWSE